jgi:hypothetical protein
MSMNNSNDTIGNQARNLPTCSEVRNHPAPPRASLIGGMQLIVHNRGFWWKWIVSFRFYRFSLGRNAPWYPLKKWQHGPSESFWTIWRREPGSSSWQPGPYWENEECNNDSNKNNDRKQSPQQRVSERPGYTPKTVGTVVWIVPLQTLNDAVPQLRHLYGVNWIRSVIIWVSGIPRIQLPPLDLLLNTESTPHGRFDRRVIFAVNTLMVECDVIVILVLFRRAAWLANFMLIK